MKKLLEKRKHCDGAGSKTDVFYFEKIGIVVLER